MPDRSGPTRPPAPPRAWHWLQPRFARRKTCSPRAGSPWLCTRAIHRFIAAASSLRLAPTSPTACCSTAPSPGACKLKGGAAKACVFMRKQRREPAPVAAWTHLACERRLGQRFHDADPLGRRERSIEQQTQDKGVIVRVAERRDELQHLGQVF